jgi:hypothetical protein
MVALLLLASCKTQYTVQYFSFPPGSKAHEVDWTHLGTVRVSSRGASSAQRSKKLIRVRVWDQSEALLLDDRLECVSAGIRTQTDWQAFDSLEVLFLEEGNQYADDPYNRELLRTGARRLFSITYKYSKDEGRFQRMSLTEGES